MATQSLYPRPEYPRPDFQRGTTEGRNWLNLNGPWQFRFDPGNLGEPEQWFSTESLDWREQIIVPFCWESLAAWGEADAAGNDNYYSTRVFRNPLEVTRANHRSAQRYETGWYRRWVEIPRSEEWQGKRVILHIGAADFFTDCWCNGVHLGRHEGGYTPFEFDLTETLETSPDGNRRALIVLRVVDPMDNAEQPVGKQWRWYTTTSGIWQTVFVEPRDPFFIRSFRVLTDIEEGLAVFQVECAGGAQGEIDAVVVDSGGMAQRLRFPISGGRGEGRIKPDRLLLWDPNSPHLYKVVFHLKSGERTTDTVRTYFGMRKVDFEVTGSGVPSGLRLNGVPRYLRGALYQSYYPEGVYTASSVETLRQDIQHAKGFGFNFLRIHIKIDDPLLLYYADKLGILLMADFPNFGEGGDTPLGRQRFEAMMRKGIERDFNHPSIFAWCLFNETWGFGGQTELIEHLFAPVKTPPPPAAAPPAAKPKRPAAGERPGMVPPQEWVQQMWELAKSLDLPGSLRI
jgi:beta-galactosidase/beta-glucuronidase